MSNWEQGRFEFESEYILLSEGRADKAFFGRLIEVHKLPKFDMPWPVLEKEIAHLPKDSDDQKYQGRDGFKPMLSAIAMRNSMRPKARGILIVIDAGDTGKEAFDYVCEQIMEVNKLIREHAKAFPVPDKPMEVAPGNGGMPSVCIMLIPLKGPGALETLCVEYLKQHEPSFFDAAEKYLSTPPIDISAWGKEKQDKARFQCIIAGWYKENPTLAVQGSFHDKRGFISLQDPMFLPIRDKISAFCENISRQVP